MTHAHVWQNYLMDDATAQRHRIAAMSWPLLWNHGVESVPVQASDFTRDARTIGDTRAIPFVNDVFAKADADRVIFTNTDVGFLADPFDWIKDNLDRFGCCYAHRKDYGALWEPPRPGDWGEGYGGADLFAFTRDWYTGVRLPDMLLGYEGWDFVVKRAMNASGFPREPQYWLYHEEHRPRWKTVLLTSPGQLYNRRVCAAWAKEHGHADEILNEAGGYLFK